MSTLSVYRSPVITVCHYYDSDMDFATVTLFMSIYTMAGKSRAEATQNRQTASAMLEDPLS